MLLSRGEITVPYAVSSQVVLRVFLINDRKIDREVQAHKEKKMLITAKLSKMYRCRRKNTAAIWEKETMEEMI